MWIVEKMARRYEDEYSKGQTCEGLLLAYNLDKSIDRHRTKYDFKNIKFPPTTKEVMEKIEELPDLPEKAAARWYRESNDSLKVTIEHPFIFLIRNKLLRKEATEKVMRLRRINNICLE